MKRMLINATQKEELRVALVDGQRLYDLDIETVSNKQKKANIYKGRITRVEPSLEAAFVDYGAERHGFLPIKEISKEYFSGSTATTNGRPDYKKLIQEGQEVMVQVEKEERGNKGAALTTYIGLAGRYLVLMPNNAKGGGVSRRIQGTDRKELKETLEQVEVPEGASAIIRTAGVGRSQQELQWDMDYQMQVWKAISEAYGEVNVGALLYQESNIIVRALRDYFREDIAQILVDDQEVYQRAHAFMSLVMPDKLSRLKLYQDELPLFTRYQIEAQIDSAYGRNVRLPSGGELVIDYTEAMVSVDINSARSTKGADVETTALNTNLEAAEEVARQLRLRDIGGLVVIDFIDMYEAKHRRLVEDKVKDAIRIDRARVQTSRISKFGLLEMSRQRLSPSIDEASHTVCPRCKGQGSIRSTQSVALSVLRLIEEDAIKENTAKVIVQLPVKVATYLLNEKRKAISTIERNAEVTVVIVANDSLETPHFSVDRIRNDDDSYEGIVSYKLAADFQYKEESSSDTKPQSVEQEAKVKTIEPVAPPPKPKVGFFKLIKKVLFGGEAASAKTKSKSEEKPAAKSGNGNVNKQGKNKRQNSERNDKDNRSNDNRDNRNNRNNGNSGNGKKDTEQSVNKRNQEQNNNKRNAQQERNTQQDNRPQNNQQGDKQSDNQAKQNGKGRNNQTKQEKKPFVNPYTKDESKVYEGRPRDENALRGQGKAGFDAAEAEAAEKNQRNRRQKETQADSQQGINKANTQAGNQADNQTSDIEVNNPQVISQDATNNERVYIPRAVHESVPALWMSDNVENTTENTAEADTAKAETEVQAGKNEKSEVEVSAEKPVGKTQRPEPAKSNQSSQVNQIAALSQFGQSVWLDNINRDMLESGSLKKLIDEDDLRGITSNPAIFEKAIASNHPGYLSYLEKIKVSVESPKEAFFELAIKDIKEACQLMNATYDKTDFTDGMVSLEVSPDIANDAEKTIDEALVLFTKLGCENAMIKVPGTQAGLVAIEQLTYQGININVTLLFSVTRYIEVFKAYMRGLERRVEMGLPVDKIRSVASFFISRIDSAIDPLVAEKAPELKGKVAIANAKLAYAAYEAALASPEWQALAAAGAVPQRLLWASTSTKDPSYSPVLYVDELIGKDTVNTLPPATYDIFKTAGTVAETITVDVAEAESVIAKLAELEIDLAAITAQLEDDGIAAFEKSFETLLGVIAEKMGN